MNSGITLEEIKRLFNYLEENKTNDNLQIIMTTEGCNDLYKLFIDFNKYQKMLEERIDKAIEYIEDKEINYATFNSKDLLDTGVGYDLWKILKGEENKQLKELNVCVGCNNNPDYKSRIDKTLLYIEELYTRYIADYSDIERLEKILKGE